MSLIEEETSEDHLFEKYQGRRRWLGKEHHKGKEELHKQLKDKLLIEKTINGSNDEKLSKKKENKILDECKDELNLNVYYSMNKKNRWIDSDPMNLLKSIPSDCQGEVVDRNILRDFEFCTDKDAVFGVHSKCSIDKNDPSEFEIRNAETSSSRGQNYLSFLPKSRELSEKKGKKSKNMEEEEKYESIESSVTFNLYRTTNIPNIVGSQMFKSKKAARNAMSKHRNSKNQKEIYENYDDFEYSDEEEEEDYDENHKKSEIMNLPDHLIHKSRQADQVRHHKSDSDSDFEVLDDQKDFQKLINIPKILNESGYTFMSFMTKTVSSENRKTFNWENEIVQIRNEHELRLIRISEDEILIDVSEWLNHNHIMSVGEFKLFIGVIDLKNEQFLITVNSTISSRLNASEIMSSFSSSEDLLDLVRKLQLYFDGRHSDIKELETARQFLSETGYEEHVLQQGEAEKLLGIPFPNRYIHEKWANSDKLTKKGIIQKWKHICETVREVHNIHSNPNINIIGSKDEICSNCNIKNQSNNHLFISNNSFICRNCLRNQFEKEFELQNFPIDLKISTSENIKSFDILPAIIPLPILNYYIRKMFESIYFDLGATGHFITCPKCQSCLYFDNSSDLCDICCDCDYTWCSKCKSEPHWPMRCEEYQLWMDKWNLRYDLEIAQGDGNDKLYRVVCSCRSSIFHIRTPNPCAKCSECGQYVSIETMRILDKSIGFIHMSAKSMNNERVWRQANPNSSRYCGPYEPIGLAMIQISELPQIQKSVVEACASARKLRFNKELKKDLKSDQFQSLNATITYLVENVTAWMYISNNFDRKIRQKLEILMNQRVYLTKENISADVIENMGSSISEIIRLVEERRT